MHQGYALIVVILLSAVVAITGMSQAKEPATKHAFQSFSMSAPITVLDAAKLDRVADGMTLGAIVEELGPGWMSAAESAGIITWFFSDNRQLCIWPSDYKSDEIITKKGDGGRARMWIEPSRLGRQIQIRPSTAPATTQSSGGGAAAAG
jgi:hypothetical protein